MTLEKSLFDIPIWLQSEVGQNFLRDFDAVKGYSLHIFNPSSYLVFREVDITELDWGCAASLLRGFDENSEYLVEFLGKYTPAHVICVGEGDHYDGIRNLLGREPNFSVRSRFYGDLSVFTDAHREL